MIIPGLRPARAGALNSGLGELNAQMGHAEVAEFGPNPGALRMWSCLPPVLASKAPLVVALHGCTQTAASYDFGSGWSTLAKQHGFALLMPEQRLQNNPNLCFNWFSPEDSRRRGGEAMSIKQMIDHMIEAHDLDPSRVFIAGLSAGGAMACTMLAAYPETFAAGAVIAGLPHGSAATVQEAFEAMAQGRDRSPQHWSDLVQTASPHSGPWPRVSVWHGGADATVNPANAESTIAQWTYVHGLEPKPATDRTVGPARHRIWRDTSGVALVEAITISGMPHGVAIDLSDTEPVYGNASPYHFDVGISSCKHIAGFWGLRDAVTLSAQKPASRRGEPATSRQLKPALTDPSAVIAAALEKAGLLGAARIDSKAMQDRAQDAGEVVRATLKSLGLLKK